MHTTQDASKNSNHEGITFGTFWNRQRDSCTL